MTGIYSHCRGPLIFLKAHTKQAKNATSIPAMQWRVNMTARVHFFFGYMYMKLRFNHRKVKADNNRRVGHTAFFSIFAVRSINWNLKFNDHKKVKSSKNLQYLNWNTSIGYKGGFSSIEYVRERERLKSKSNPRMMPMAFLKISYLCMRSQDVNIVIELRVINHSMVCFYALKFHVLKGKV